MNHNMARRLVGLFIAGLLQITVSMGQETITATVQDAIRVHVTFLTMDVLMDRCADGAAQPALFEAARTDWMQRNAETRDFADIVLEYYKAEANPEELQPRAEEDAAAMLNSIVTPRELCDRFLRQIPAGELDLSNLVPDLDERLAWSATAIAGEAN